MQFDPLCPFDEARTLLPEFSSVHGGLEAAFGHRAWPVPSRTNVPWLRNRRSLGLTRTGKTGMISANV